MIKFSRAIFISTSMLLIAACTTKSDLFVSYTNPQIEYSGRIDTTQIQAAELYWSGSSIKINFEGESIQALLKDNNGDNYYNIIIDNDSLFILKPDTIQKYYSLTPPLAQGKHSVEIFKRTEWDRGKTAFYGFQITGDAKVLPKPLKKKRKIEFYGNSITAGYAVEDLSGKDSPDSTYTNNYISYAALSARHFNAEFQCICKSGIGMTISWFPLIMPEMYDRLIPTDATSKWDFSLYKPDIVVINLFQNDSWLVSLPEREEFKTNFGNKAPSDEDIINAYQQFVGKIRKHYPETNIICMLGNMDASTEGSIWIDYVQQAVSNLNDNKIYTHIAPYKNTVGHPSIKEQKDMANKLIHFIDENIAW